jgi:hypothetical protein
MPKKSASRRDAERRAEARRRTRLAAQGQSAEQEDEEPETAAPARRAGTPLLQRFFPPAPPLPGKSEPLRGFTYAGRFSFVVSSLWLIPRNLIAGVGMGAVWAISYLLSVQLAGSLPGTIAAFVSFGALVAAGWLGWQRPWLYGFVAAVVGYLIYAGYVVYTAVTAPALSLGSLLDQPFVPQAALDLSGGLKHFLQGPAGPSVGLIAQFLAANGAMQAGIGALAGFYGGYLRRRLAEPGARKGAAPQRRR